MTGTSIRTRAGGTAASPSLSGGGTSIPRTRGCRAGRASSIARSASFISTTSTASTAAASCYATLPAPGAGAAGGAHRRVSRRYHRRPARRRLAPRARRRRSSRASRRAGAGDFTRVRLRRAGARRWKADVSRLERTARWVVAVLVVAVLPLVAWSGGCSSSVTTPDSGRGAAAGRAAPRVPAEPAAPRAPPPTTAALRALAAAPAATVVPRVRGAAVTAAPTVPTAAFSAVPARSADAPTIGVNCRFAPWGLAAARVRRTASS